MTKTFTVPAILSGASFLKDGGMGLHFKTQELTTEEKTVIGDYVNQFGWLLFKETEFKDDDTKQLEAIRKDTGGKSPSQRLRAILYVLYQQRGENDIMFEQFYAQQIEKVIDNIKTRLDT